MAVGDNAAAPLPLEWDQLTAYIDASASESTAMMQALGLRLRMPQGAFSPGWPAPEQQQQQRPVALQTSSLPVRPAAMKKSRKKKKTRRAFERRSTKPCANCRRRHRRCDSDAGKGTCTECTAQKLVCTFASSA